MTTTISGTMRILADFNVRKIDGAASINAVHTVDANDAVATANTSVVWTLSGTIGATGTITYDTQDSSLSNVFGDAVVLEELSTIAIINDSSTADLECVLSDVRGVGADTTVLLGPGGTFAVSLPTYPAGGGVLTDITLTGTDGEGYTILATGKATTP